MGKTGQGFLPPLTHPLSQHRPQASGLQWQRQSRTYSQPPVCESIQSLDGIKSVTFVDSSVNLTKYFRLSYVCLVFMACDHIETCR